MEGQMAVGRVTLLTLKRLEWSTSIFLGCCKNGCFNLEKENTNELCLFCAFNSIRLY